MQYSIIFPITVELNKNELCFKNKGSIIYNIIFYFLAFFMGGYFGFALFNNFIMAIIFSVSGMFLMRSFYKAYMPPKKSIINLKNNTLTTISFLNIEKVYPLNNIENALFCDEFSIKSNHVRRYHTNIRLILENTEHSQEKKGSVQKIKSINIAQLPGKYSGPNERLKKLLQAVIRDYKHSNNLKISFEKIIDRDRHFDQLVYGKYFNNPQMKILMTLFNMVRLLLKYAIFTGMIYLCILTYNKLL
ncbi:hypothetical protein [Photobacterium nomapromontoriensis]|uniref:hypothetical protein n=1 Tax=Photobacterium nomapromontoriensis TaxID=2910237 RepID=UPI003D0EDDC6